MMKIESNPQNHPTRVQDSAAVNRAPETQITLSLTECRRILVHNWDLLSEKTKGHLQSLGIYPKVPETSVQPAPEVSQNRNI